MQWVERLDASTGRSFWGHITTKKTTWDEPEEIKAWREACNARGDVWVKAMDPKKKRPFYVHCETKESTWHRPGGRIITKEEHYAQKMKEKHAENNSGAPAPVVWEKHFDDVTKTEYYFNRESNKTVWSLPSDDDNAGGDETWISAIDPSTESTYYINPKTGETTWEKPTRVSSHSVVVPAKKNATTSFRETFFGRKKKPSPLEALHTAASGHIQADGIVQGWLWKKGSSSTFQRAYFALHTDGRLRSYASPEDFQSEKPADEGDVLLVSSAVSVMLSEDAVTLNGSSAFAIDITLRNGSVASLGVIAVEDMQLWLEALQRCSSSTVTPSSSGEQEATFITNIAESVQQGDADEILSKFKESRKTTGMQRSQKGSIRGTSRRVSSKAKSLGLKSRIRSKHHSANPPVSPGKTENVSFETWATKGGFSELVDRFRAAGYDSLELLQELNEDDVKQMLHEDMAVEKPGHRMKVVVALRKLRGAAQQQHSISN